VSLHPDNAYCTKCFGVIPLGQFGRKLKSCCTCEDEQLTDVQPDPLKHVEPRKAA